MPKYYIYAKECVYYRGYIDAESRQALEEMDLSEQLEEYDSSGFDISSITEVKDITISPIDPADVMGLPTKD